MIELHDVKRGRVVVNAFRITSIMPKGEYVEVRIKNHPMLTVKDNFDCVYDTVCNVIARWEDIKLRCLAAKEHKA